MVAFYIAFMEADISESLAVEFAYVYRIKALARNEGFRYTSKRRLDVREFGESATTWTITRIYTFSILLITLESYGWQVSSDLPLILSFYTLFNLYWFWYIFFVDPRPSPKLREEQEVQVATFNSLIENQRIFRELVTTPNLHKYCFFHWGASLLGNSRRLDTESIEDPNLLQVSLSITYLLNFLVDFEHINWVCFCFSNTNGLFLRYLRCSKKMALCLLGLRGLVMPQNLKPQPQQHLFLPLL